MSRAPAQGVLDSGQSFADAGVVHYPAVFERDVEIDAHEDAVIVEGRSRMESLASLDVKNLGVSVATSFAPRGRLASRDPRLTPWVLSSRPRPPGRQRPRIDAYSPFLPCKLIRSRTRQE